MGPAVEPTVFVLHPDAVVRSHLAGLLALANLHVEVCASAEELLESYDARTPGCLVLDLQVAGIAGLELQGYFRDRHAGLPVVVARAGDYTFAERTALPGEPIASDLIDRVRSAIDADLHTRRRNARAASISRRIASLSVPERQVLELLIEGIPNKAIAMRLQIAERTVEDRRARIMAKLEVNSFAELVRMAAILDELGWRMND